MFANTNTSITIDRLKKVLILKFRKEMVGLETLILFNLFRAIALISALVVVLSKSSMQSIFSLILVFCSAAGMSLILQAEFIALSFVIIYVGAIAVLFLFVIIMLNTRIEEVHTPPSLVSFPHSTFLITVFVLEISLFLFSSFSESLNESANVEFYSVLGFSPSLTIEAIGSCLYTNFSIPFLASGLILLLAMIGSVSLTLLQNMPTRREDVRRKCYRWGEKGARYLKNESRARQRLQELKNYREQHLNKL